MKNANEIKISEPCSKRWAELEGAGTRRYCGSCELHVVDGSALTKAAAESLIEEAPGRVCMRLEFTEEGHAIHAPEPSKEPKIGRTTIGLSLAAGILVACSDQLPEPSPPTEAIPVEAITPSTDKPLERPLEIMGEICYPTELPEPNDAPVTLKAEEHVDQLPVREMVGRIGVQTHPSER